MAVADSVSLDQLQAWCSSHEKVLRWQYGGALPVSWEAELASVEANTAANAVQRLALLKHFYRSRHEEQERKNEPPDEETQQRAARQLLRREPVEVDLGARKVYVTARSYACMAEIARHDARIRALGGDYERLHRRIRIASEAIPVLTGAERAKHRRRLRRYIDAANRIQLEMTHQRLALWSHALTPTGAPADEISVPDWWTEITPSMDASLLAGLIEAGAGRYSQMGPPPEDLKKKGMKGEQFGWSTLFATVERQHDLPPASLYDRDLYQTLAWLRAGAPPPAV